MSGDNTNNVTLLFNDKNPNKNGFITENPASPNLSDSRTEIRNYGGSTTIPGGIGRANKEVLKDMFSYEGSSSFYNTSSDLLSVSQFVSGRDDLSGNRLNDEISRAIQAIEEYIARNNISEAERRQAEQDLGQLIDIRDNDNLSLLDENIELISEQIGGDVSYNPDFETGSVNFSYLNTDDRVQSDVQGKSYNINSIAETPARYVFPEIRESGFGSTNDISAGGRNIIDQILSRYRT